MGSTGDKEHDKQLREEEAFVVFLDKLKRKDDINVTPQRAKLSRDVEDRRNG